MILTVKAEVSVTVLQTGLVTTDTHSIAQKERSIFWEVRVPVVVRRNLI
jgi:hypothetical protein